MSIDLTKGPQDVASLQRQINDLKLQINALPGLGPPKVITTSAYDLAVGDDQPSMLVLSASSATVITVSAGVVSGGFTQLVVDEIGGGSVAVGSGVTLLATHGSATASAGDEITIACPFDNVVVLGGSTS